MMDVAVISSNDDGLPHRRCLQLLSLSKIEAILGARAKGTQLLCSILIGLYTIYSDQTTKFSVGLASCNNDG